MYIQPHPLYFSLTLFYFSLSLERKQNIKVNLFIVSYIGADQSRD
jgi:hypothetical protein